MPYQSNEIDEQIPFLHLMSTYIGYLILTVFGHARDYFGMRFNQAKYRHLSSMNGYAPLTSDFESFYTRRFYKRLRDCWNRPTTGVPTRTVTVLERASSDYNDTFELTGNRNELINLSSYNYLGFSDTHSPCTEDVEQCLNEYGICVFSTRLENGNLDIHRKLEKMTADFLGKEDAIISNMGFATNSLIIPSFVGKECLLISDELNHSSIVTGCRLSGAAIKTIKHLNMKHLERVLRKSIAEGQPKTHRPWKKIILMLEGLYSMEGDIPDLVKVMELKRKYKFYLFIDEAHSIGAMGRTGRGVCEFRGISTEGVDLLMGTFTKSFGAAGGYIAGNKELIEYLKKTSISYQYAEPMPPFICQQIISSIQMICGTHPKCKDGANKLRAILDNSIYFSRRLKELGYVVLGEEGSPVVPVLIVHPCKLKMFSIECLKRGLAVVVVGYPATPLITSRARFCISASHTQQDLEFALKKLDEVGSLLNLKMGNSKIISVIKYSKKALMTDKLE